MAGRSVKELVDEIDSLSIIDLAKLKEALEEKLGISVEPQPQDHFWEDYRYFCKGYDITITADYNGIAEKVQLIKKLCNTLSYSLNEAKDLIAELPKTIAHLQPRDDALEIRKKYMEAGLKVELKWTWGYISRHEYLLCYNTHQRNQLTDLQPIPDIDSLE